MRRELCRAGQIDGFQLVFVAVLINRIIAFASL